MSKQEKIQFVELLESHGAFLLKGAVEYVAKSLGVTKYTIYNYLKEVRMDNNSNTM
jgi:predicted transcriptional regulator YheO